MSQNQSAQDDTCITIIPENNAQLSVPAEQISCSGNNNEQTSSSRPVETLNFPKSNDANANADDPNRTSPGTLNSDVLASRLISWEEQRQLEDVNNGDRQNHNSNERVRILEYQSEYPITRFSRTWKRPEVQGLCCIVIEIICLSTLAVLSFKAVGFLNPLKDDGHLPLTFSWKILWNFFGNSAIPKPVNDCLYRSLSGRLAVREEDNYGSVESIAPVMDVNYVFFDVFSDNEKPNIKAKSPPTLQPTYADIADRNLCEFRPTHNPFGWLMHFFFITNIMSTLSLVTSSILYTSLSIRRRKGMQVLLLLPSFFCFFVSIFNQIPRTFTFSYFDQTLIKEMHQSLSQSTPPYHVVPILDETQIHRQCCGVEIPASWETFGLNVYPPSCCNTTAFNCSKLEPIKREHVWSVGCYQVEYSTIQMYERVALFLYAFKVIAEVGIFCTLSDLTRFDYPAPEVTETSRCEFRDYQIKCRGVMHIKGVTKDGHIVVESRYFLPWRLVPSRTDMINGLHLYVKTDQNRTKGSVEVVKRQHVTNFLNEHIQLDLSRKNRGIFVFTLN